jgi:hypothetical protein
MAATGNRALAWVLAVILLVLGVVGIAWNIVGPKLLSPSQERLQTLINEHLPYHWKYGVSVTEVALDLSHNDKAAATLIITRDKKGEDATAEGIPPQLSGVVYAEGTVKYLDGEAFFIPDVVDVLEVDTRGTNIIEKAHSFIDKRIHPQWLNEKAHAAVDTGDAKARQAVNNIARAYLSASPVYRVKDDVKGLVIKASVTAIEVKSWQDGKGGNLIIHASILRLRATMLLWGLFFGAALFIAARLVLRPRAGLKLMLPLSRPRSSPADDVIE